MRSPLLLLSHLVLPYSPAEKEGLARSEWYFKSGSGYVAEQTTQPQTLGYALADSPVGLLAWVYEKLVLWTDAYPWGDDEGACPVACVLKFHLLKKRTHPTIASHRRQC